MLAIFLRYFWRVSGQFSRVLVTFNESWRVLANFLVTSCQVFGEILACIWRILVSFDKFKARFYRVTANFGRRFLASFLASFDECWRVFGEFLASFGEFVCFFATLASFVEFWRVL